MNNRNSADTDTCIIVFIKNPRLGYVKTRLARDVGDEKALEIYLRLTEHTRAVLSSVPGINRYVYYSDFIDNSDGWNSESFDKALQSDGDLGDKMKSAFSEVLQSHKKAIIIGSDCAQLNTEHIQSAIDQLDNTNVVIGPTFDGGYYLLGMDDNYPFLFEDMVWSIETVFDVTKSKAEDRGLKVNTVEKLSDIDYVEDWEKYGLDS